MAKNMLLFESSFQFLKELSHPLWRMVEYRKKDLKLYNQEKILKEAINFTCENGY